jgi:signal transduction histidine kinase
MRNSGLNVTENNALLSVRDFGRGMPARSRPGFDLNDSHVGVGLSGMRERVTDLGGSFAIESDSHGTAIIVSVPLAAQPSGKSRPGQGDLGRNFAA